MLGYFRSKIIETTDAIHPTAEDAPKEAVTVENGLSNLFKQP